MNNKTKTGINEVEDYDKECISDSCLGNLAAI
jgi:hypothetical protein